MNEEITLSSSLERIKDAVDDIREMTGELGTIEDVVSAVSNLGRVPEVYFVKNKEEMEGLNAVLDDLCLVRDNTHKSGAIDNLDGDFNLYPSPSRRIYFPENISLNSPISTSVDHAVEITEWGKSGTLGGIGEIRFEGSSFNYSLTITSDHPDAEIDILYTSQDGQDFHRDRCIINDIEVYGNVELPYFLSFYNNTGASRLEIHEKCMRSHEIAPWKDDTRSDNIYLRKSVTLSAPLSADIEGSLSFPGGGYAQMVVSGTSAQILYDNSDVAFEATWVGDSTELTYTLTSLSCEGPLLRGNNLDDFPLEYVSDGVVLPLTSNACFVDLNHESTTVNPILLKFLGVELDTITDLYKYNDVDWDIINE